MTDTLAPPDAPARPSRRRWLGLVGLTAGIFVTVLDSTILTVATPTLMADLGTDLRAIEWVIAGYSLVFAGLLVLAGRLGDLVGHRRMVVAGIVTFAAGSLVAARAQDVTGLLVGDALLEGLGAALMGSSSLSLVNAGFRGPQRNTAFALYGVMGGSAGAFGPVIGGWLTTHASWRWAFGINVVLTPILVALVLTGVREVTDRSARRRFDAAGVALATVASLLCVFALLEAPRYGWWTALEPSPTGLSVIPLCLAGAAAAVALFVVVERRRDRAGHDPVYPFSRLDFASFRHGTLTSGVLAVGEFSMFFVLALVLQQQLHLSALDAGLWVLPFGLMIIVGAGIGSGLATALGAKRTVVLGMTLEALGLVWIALVIGPDLRFVALIPAIVVYGTGAGFATAQLSNLTMAEVPHDVAGAASGVVSTVRAVGTALGIALVGTALGHGSRAAVMVTVAAVVVGVVSSALIPAAAAAEA